MTEFQRVLDELRQPCSQNPLSSDLLWNFVAIGSDLPSSQQCMVVSMLARHNRVDVLGPLVERWQQLDCSPLRQAWGDVLGRALVVSVMSNHLPSAELLLPCATQNVVDRALETAITYQCCGVLALLVPSASAQALTRAIEQCCMSGHLPALQCVLPAHQAAACHQVIALLHGHASMVQYLKEFVTLDQVRGEEKYGLLSRSGQQLCRDIYGRA